MPPVIGGQMNNTKEPTLLAHLISEADVNSELDNSCKKLLSHKHILAWILKYAVTEFTEHSVEAIAHKYILEDTIQIATTPAKQLQDVQVSGLNPECKPFKKAKNTYDLLFRVYLPGSQKTVNMLINIEAQGNFYPRYPLLKRGIFYVCRLISSQIGGISDHADYSKLQKVYSIWICTNPPRKRSHSITKYCFTEQNILGRARALRKNYDLLSPTLSAEQKQDILENRFKLPINTEMKEDMNYMCNISKSIKIEALKEGFYKGINQGRAEGVSQGMFQTCLSNLKSLMQNLSLTATQAMDVLNIPQEERSQYFEHL